MSLKPSLPSHQTLRALQHNLLGADDKKIREIINLLERSTDYQFFQTVLEPLRPRLASLGPVRQIRFTRLLFTPLDRLIVPALDWRPGRATIPRSILNAISDTVHVALGHEADEIERLIVGRDTDETEVITQAGQVLWRHAGDILAQAPPAKNWEATGLPATIYPPFARNIATVLRTAAPLRCLLREAELRAPMLDEHPFTAIIQDMIGEPAEGCAMVFKLMLVQYPRAVALLQRLIEAERAPAEKTLLRATMDRGIDEVLTDMESEIGWAKIVRSAPLSDVCIRMQQVTMLMQDMTEHAPVSRYHPRLREIREKLDPVCRARFADGIKTGLFAPLANAVAPIGTADQRQMESCARDLRSVEMAARRLGSTSIYDDLLLKAGEAVQAAEQAGKLTPVRSVRLIEILLGSDAAEKIFNNGLSSTSAISVRSSC